MLAEKHIDPRASQHSGLRLRDHAVLETSRVNGPGRRAVIWLQGCSLGCKKCWNPATHLSEGGLEMTVTAVVGLICKLWDRDIMSGLTVSGGEPMEQALALAT